MEDQISISLLRCLSVVEIDEYARPKQWVRGSLPSCFAFLHRLGTERQARRVGIGEHLDSCVDAASGSVMWTLLEARRAVSDQTRVGYNLSQFSATRNGGRTFLCPFSIHWRGPKHVLLTHMLRR